MQLFVYGTLLDQCVWQRIVGRPSPGRPAILEGYQRRALIGAHFPGIVAVPGERVLGLCFSGLNPDDLHRLDHYEGGWYRREEVCLMLPRGGEERAWTYILQAAEQWRLDGDWSPSQPIGGVHFDGDCDRYATTRRLS